MTCIISYTSQGLTGDRKIARPIILSKPAYSAQCGCHCRSVNGGEAHTSKREMDCQCLRCRQCMGTIVGPSPGTGPGGKIDHAVPPVLGTVLPEFVRFATPANDKNGFWRELFRLLRQGFKHAGLARDDEDAALKLMMLMNLDTTPQGDGAKVTQEMLRAGLPRLSCILGVTRPRLIVALTERVYKEISQWWSRDQIGKVGQERRHNGVPTKRQCYYGRSRWLTRANEGSMLLAKILQHPSRASFYRGYETLFSDYLGERIADAIVERA
jgi:hypothetical protein